MGDYKPCDIPPASKRSMIGFSNVTGWKYMKGEKIMELFEVKNKILVSREEYGENTHNVISYFNGHWWTVVHPSATATIEALDEYYKKHFYLSRSITMVPNDLLYKPEYWNP